jgi:putative transposase
LAVPGHPHHLLIRGNNQQPIFVDDQDRQRLLEHLAEALRSLPLTLHAYVLMPNHVHLLATPQAADTLGRAAQSLGRRYVGYFNARHGRSGTLWEGRYRAHVVGGQEEVLRCMRFIESNPQRSGLAAGLFEPAWSSLAHHLGALRDPLIAEPAAYWQLGNTPFEREAAYRAWMEQGIGPAEARRIVSALIGGRPLGGPAFVADLEKQLGRTLTPRPRGRPRKANAPKKTVPI